MKKLTHDFVKKQYKIFGYKLLSEYKNNYTKNLVECAKGHQYKVTYGNFQKGQRCPICYNKIRSNGKKLTHNFVKSEYIEFGYKLLSEYKNNRVKDLIECPEGHQFKVKYYHFKQGSRCPICWNVIRYSRSEKDCLDIVKQIISEENVVENDRTQIINPKTNQFLELDIWIPSLNKAIEFNGEYWHRSDYSKYKDNQKKIQCEKKGIDLMIIEERAWLDSRNKKIDKIKEFFNG